MKKKHLNLLVLLVLLISCVSQAQTADFKTGTWQSIIDGKPGEGAFFYRMNFESNGTLNITKQMGGVNNIIETKQWLQKENSLIIKSNENANITEFDGKTITIISNDLLSFSNGTYEGKIKPYKHGLAVVHWLLILVVLILLNELFRKSKWAGVIFFFVLPALLTPLVWAGQGVTYWFKWVKVYSVVFAAIWFTFIRYSKTFGSYNLVKFIAASFLAINIAEAVSQDFSMGYLPNILNGIAGILSIITLYYGWKQIGPDKSKEKDMVWPLMPVLWIIAYDVWNIVYVYLNFPGSTSAQFMVLLSCTIPALFIKKGTWLQARAYTLAAWFMYYFTFPRFTEQMELLVPRNTSLMLAAAILSIGLNLLYTFFWVKNVFNKPQQIEVN